MLPFSSPSTSTHHHHVLFLNRRDAWRLPLLSLLVFVFLAAPRLTLAQDQTGTPDAAATPTSDPLTRATDWLIAQQGPDGGFVGFSGGSDPGLTADAVVALHAASVRGIDVDAPLTAASGYLLDVAPDVGASGPGQTAKLILALVALGIDPTTLDAGQTDLLASLGTVTPETGLYGTGVYDHALVLMARAAINLSIDTADIEALRARQTPDGSWAFDGATSAGAGDSNTTALVIQALVATGHGTDPLVLAGLDYLRSLQTDTGGFPFQPGGEVDGNSTSLGLQAIVAVGQDPSTPEWRNAAAALVAFQNASGAMRYTNTEPSDNLFATVQAIPALAGVPLPVATVCVPVADGAATPVGTPIVALPEPARGAAPCIELEAA